MMNKAQNKMRQTQLPTIGRKNLIICGPKVFNDQMKFSDPKKFLYAIVSRSLQKPPKGCDILSSEPNPNPTT